MSFWQIIVLAIWGIIGLYRYIECEDDDGESIDPDLRKYSFYTIFVHGPFWWLVWIGVHIRDFLGSLDWSWFGRIFKIEKKEK